MIGATITLTGIPAEERRRMAHNRSRRAEARGSSFQERVRAGYLELAAADDRIEIVDAGGGEDAVHHALVQRVAAMLESGA